MAESEATYRTAERRIEHLTLGLGAVSAAFVGFRWGWRAAAGFALGAGLAWLNYRWLKQGVGAVAQLAAAQSDAANVRVPKSVYVKFLGRFALLVAAVYVILSYSLLPATALLAGLFTLVAAVLAELILELVRGGPRQSHGGPPTGMM